MMDLKDGTSNMFELFQKDAVNKETEKDLWMQLNRLEEQLEFCTITTLEMCKNLKCVLGSEHFNVSTKFVALQGKHQHLCNKITVLEKELNNYKIASTNDMDKLTLQFEKCFKQQEEQGKLDIKEIQQQIDKRRSDHSRIVQQLYNELDLAQAATALQQDEVETELCKELVDINVKIRQMKNINDDLRSELDDLKVRQQSRELQKQQNVRTSLYNKEKDVYTDQITITTTFQNEEVSNFPQNIQVIYEETNAAINSSTNRTSKANSNSMNNVPKISHTFTKKYDMGTQNQPLSVSGTKPHCDRTNDNKNIMVFSKPNTTRTVKNIMTNLDVNEPEKSKMILKDINKKEQANASKKRRLFDPDDLDYLNNIDISQTEK